MAPFQMNQAPIAFICWMGRPLGGGQGLCRIPQFCKKVDIYEMHSLRYVQIPLVHVIRLGPHRRYDCRPVSVTRFHNCLFQMYNLEF
jgi:hypothetical protein